MLQESPSKKTNREVSAPPRATGPGSPFARPGVRKVGGVPVRRFEMGASGEGWDRFLNNLGYTITASGGSTRMYKITDKAGRLLKSPRRTNWHSMRELMALLDAERLRCGLQPIVKANAP